MYLKKIVLFWVSEDDVDGSNRWLCSMTHERLPLRTLLLRLFLNGVRFVLFFHSSSLSPTLTLSSLLCPQHNSTISASLSLSLIYTYIDIHISSALPLKVNFIPLIRNEGKWLISQRACINQPLKLNYGRIWMDERCKDGERHAVEPQRRQPTSLARQPSFSLLPSYIIHAVPGSKFNVFIYTLFHCLPLFSLFTLKRHFSLSLSAVFQPF